MKKFVFSIFTFVIYTTSQAQEGFSIATDFSLLRSISKNQGFFAIGQTIQGNVHFTNTESLYAWLSYYTNGTFKNTLTATAKDPTTSPRNINYTSSSKLSYQQISIGWKHFFVGGAESESAYTVYGLAGFGLVAGKIENTWDKAIDTADYIFELRAIEGSATFKRLTFDIGIGSEARLATSVYLYADLRTWLPASNFPSPYLYNNSLPRVIIASTGIRILFN
ncbi:MAG: hypothetical protein H0V91_00130 [Flavisolibacter sp.]|nr:hypothetical protein [Flavisolibacter sp.]